MKGLRCSCFFSFLIFCIIIFSGCATIKEGAKCFIGVSTKVLEDNRKTAITKTYNYDYFTTYTKTLDSLKKMEAYVYSQGIKKNLIAIYVSEEDTTPVGIFFEEVDKDNTKIEISSPSTYAKELIAKKLFEDLEKPSNP